MAAENPTRPRRGRYEAMVRVIEGLAPKDAGRFLNYDGSILSW
jgi:hypothetical protein